MSAIIPFQFEAHAVRIQVDGAGLPWFNASDVCNALEMGNPSQAIKSHVDGDDLQKLEVIDNLGRTQRANHVNESGLYALILGSTKDAAKRFKRWLTSEVLPAIRKTGSYAAPSALAALPAPTHDRVSAILLIGEAVAKVPGVKPGIAAAATLTCIQENTGITTEVLRRALPSANEPICALNATQLGKLLNRSAKATNQMLAAGGFQFRNDRDEWELTEAGEAWAEAMPYVRKELAKLLGFHESHKGGRFARFLAEIAPNSLSLLEKLSGPILLPSGRQTQFFPAGIFGELLRKHLHMLSQRQRCFRHEDDCEG